MYGFAIANFILSSQDKKYFFVPAGFWLLLMWHASTMPCALFNGKNVPTLAYTCIDNTERPIFEISEIQSELDLTPVFFIPLHNFECHKKTRTQANTIEHNISERI